MATEVAVRPRETLSVELNGINVITDAERKGRPRDLFWPWCAANIAVLGISYGSFLLGFGVSFWQATIAGLIGTILSFLLVGVVSLAGKQGSAPTMVLSRAAYGVQGGKIPAALSYILLVGWETVLVSLATLATATVFGRLGWGGGDATKIIAFLVVAGVVVFSGVFGFNVIMRLQAILTRALAPRPEGRYATAGEMLADLDAYLATLGGLPTRRALVVPRGNPFGSRHSPCFAWRLEGRHGPNRISNPPLRGRSANGIRGEATRDPQELTGACLPRWYQAFPVVQGAALALDIRPSSGTRSTGREVPGYELRLCRCRRTHDASARPGTA